MMKDLQALSQRILDFYATNELDYDNAEAFVQGGAIYSYIEAPNHTTWQVIYGDSEIEQLEADFDQAILRIIRRNVREYDADQLFNELWSEDFGRHNGFTAAEFMEMLQEDGAFFRDI